MPKSKVRTIATSNTGPLILIAAGTVLILIVLILLLFKSQASDTQAKAFQPTAAIDIPYPEITRINLNDALAAYQADNATFIDVRSAEAFTQSHIAGAINFPIEQMELTVPQLDRNTLLIPYCT